MIDLSSTLFFKAKFEIAAKQKDFDMLWCIVCHIRSWMSSKWKKRGDTWTECYGLLCDRFGFFS